MEIKFTPISTVGEFGLIEKLSSTASQLSNPNVIQAIGDDAAIIFKDTEGVKNLGSQLKSHQYLSILRPTTT